MKLTISLSLLCVSGSGAFSTFQQHVSKQILNQPKTQLFSTYDRVEQPKQIATAASSKQKKKNLKVSISIVCH